MPRKHDTDPMIPIHENGAALAREYWNAMPAQLDGPLPWHVALIEFWRFIRQRETVNMVRRVLRS